MALLKGPGSESAAPGGPGVRVAAPNFAGGVHCDTASGNVPVTGQLPRPQQRPLALALPLAVAAQVALARASEMLFEIQVP